MGIEVTVTLTGVSEATIIKIADFVHDEANYGEAAREATEYVNNVSQAWIAEDDGIATSGTRAKLRESERLTAWLNDPMDLDRRCRLAGEGLSFGPWTVFVAYWTPGDMSQEARA